MKPWRLFAILAIVVSAGALSAQDGPQRGQIKKIDADKNTLIVTSEGKDLTLQVTSETRVMNAEGQQVEEPFKNKLFTAGAAVVFKTDGQNILQGIKLEDGAGAGAGKQPPQGGIRQAKIVKVDLDKLIVTLKVDGKDLDAIATEDTKFFEIEGNDTKEKLRALKPGADAMFVTREKDGKEYLFGIKLGVGGGKGPGPKGGPPKLVKVDSSKLVPLNELGDKEYKDGFKGGFYPDGKNERPKAHEEAGLRFAKEVQPLNAEGKPDPAGKIVMLSVGMSNTSQASGGFSKAIAATDNRNPNFIFVNGAVGGQTAAITQSTESAQGAKYWGIVDQRLKEAGLSRAQVQVIWIKQADAGPNQGFPAYAKKLEDELTKLVQIFPKRFPNANLVYLSSRTYGGYATTALNPEPYAYESGFSVKWLIERQIKGDADLNYDAKKGEVKAPWLSWGPYLWANGTKKRPDGFYYEVSDFSGDGTHHSSDGSAKIGRHMVQFFQNDSTSRSWFTAK